MRKRKTFVANLDWGSFFQGLCAEDAKTLTIAMFSYAKNGEADEQAMSACVRPVWEYMKNQLCEYKQDYDEVCKRNSENGKKGGRPKKLTDAEAEEKSESEKSRRFSENLQKHDYDSDSDNDCDSDSDYERDHKKTRAHENEATRCFGKYQNVFLTDSAYRQYKRNHPDTDEVIEELSAAVKAYPNKYGGDSDALLSRFLAARRRSEPRKTAYAPPDSKPPSYDIEAALRRSRHLDPVKTKRTDRS